MNIFWKSRSKTRFLARRVDEHSCLDLPYRHKLERARAKKWGSESETKWDRARLRTSERVSERRESERDWELETGRVREWEWVSERVGEWENEGASEGAREWGARACESESVRERESVRVREWENKRVRESASERLRGWEGERVRAFQKKWRETQTARACAATTHIFIFRTRFYLIQWWFSSYAISFSWKCLRFHSNSLSLTLSLFHTLTLSFSHASLSLSLTLSLSHSLTLSLSHSLALF